MPQRAGPPDDELDDDRGDDEAPTVVVLDEGLHLTAEQVAAEHQLLDKDSNSGTAWSASILFYIKICCRQSQKFKYHLSDRAQTYTVSTGTWLGFAAIQYSPYSFAALYTYNKRDIINMILRIFFRVEIKSIKIKKK